MAEETKKSITAEETKSGPVAPKSGQASDQGAKEVVAKSVYGATRKMRRPGRRPSDEKRDEFDQRILDLARVTRVMAGGKRMRFRATVAIGDRKGKIGVGMGKGADVTLAVNKAVNDAKKKMIDIPLSNGTIPHEIYKKYGAARILFKPVAKGRGVIAGGVVRVILELGGVKNITCKILGTNNKVNNAKCTIEALKELKKSDNIKKGGKNIDVNKAIKKMEEKKEDIKK